MTPQEAIDIIDDVSWEDNGRHYGKIVSARDLAKSALEKQIPKKPKTIKQIGTSFDMRTGVSMRYYEGLCPVCKFDNTNKRVQEKVSRCEKCGQALDWSDTK